MTNYEKYKDEILDMVEDSNLYASIYDLKCLMNEKDLSYNDFLGAFIRWLEKEAE